MSETVSLEVAKALTLAGLGKKMFGRYDNPFCAHYWLEHGDSVRLVDWKTHSIWSGMTYAAPTLAEMFGFCRNYKAPIGAWALVVEDLTDGFGFQGSIRNGMVSIADRQGDTPADAAGLAIAEALKAEKEKP